MQQEHDLLSEYLGLNVGFYTLFFVCILGLNLYFYTFDQQKFQLLKSILKTNICPK